ncbi:hypothetical protein BJF83_17415 [Nocardiopsis sp. CNR-923]|uniref:hypothetical protein n=1 Tax=Nocardiopsis sp. CNR-923 TaxID=1904965 RepID=UPI000963742F|nr:hypothetical protein [Nocardiopsis sp. CNR-923]OLT27762.1 hypothetical protein BJF83_17415 [Nocardiopsis sp. CNR-923]
MSASIVRDALVSTLRTWCLVLDGDLLGTPPADDGAGLADHLTNRVENIRHHVEGGAAVDEITAAVSAARDQVHGRDRAASTLAGLCPDCQSPVYGPHGVAQARCRANGCTGMVDVAAWRENALSRLTGATLPAVDVARVASVLTGERVTGDRVRQWAARGKLTAVNTGQCARPVYRVADVCALLGTPGHRTAS